MPARPHDHDAGGDPDLLRAKAALRSRVWDLLDTEGVRRFPGVRNRISNFVGAERAAERLRGNPAWSRACTVKATPDAPQLPVRQCALEDGKTVYMAVPRLTRPEPFLVLDPDHLPERPRRVASIRGAERWGRTAPLAELEPVGLLVTGCVAVGEDGVRLGKGGGFSDLEFAIASEVGLIGPQTLVATTVHPLQVLPSGTIPRTGHDLTVDLIVTPDGVVPVEEQPGERPAGRVRWDELTEEKIASIPVLSSLREGR